MAKGLCSNYETQKTFSKFCRDSPHKCGHTQFAHLSNVCSDILYIFTVCEILRMINLPIFMDFNVHYGQGNFLTFLLTSALKLCRMFRKKQTLAEDLFIYLWHRKKGNLLYYWLFDNRLSIFNFLSNLLGGGVPHLDSISYF